MILASLYVSGFSNHVPRPHYWDNVEVSLPPEARQQVYRHLQVRLLL
jgi:hypothetical protein